jgi:hypothetical protein
MVLILIAASGIVPCNQAGAGAENWRTKAGNRTPAIGGTKPEIGIFNDWKKRPSEIPMIGNFANRARSAEFFYSIM